MQQASWDMYMKEESCMKKIINNDISRLSKMGVKGSKYVMDNYSDKIINKKIYRLIINN
jgi:hypothetical protein